LQTREKLYKSGVIPTNRLHHPVVSIGNLTLGGTGKTPLVIALANRLRNEGLRPVVLSRGYRRTTKGCLIVSRGDGPIVTWQESGDEPFLIARRARRVSVVVGADRFEAGRLAEQNDLGNIFLLDDGFQHRGLFRNVDIVTVDPVEWSEDEKLLPRGRWREPKSGIERAHAVCIQSRTGAAVPEFHMPTFQVNTAIEGIFENDRQIELESLRGRPVVAFAGIAKPERFFNSVEDLGIPISRRIQFRDHHEYNARDVAEIATGAECEPRITTEKDAVRLEDTSLSNFLHLRISANIPEFDRLMELIHSRLR